MVLDGKRAHDLMPYAVVGIVIARAALELLGRAQLKWWHQQARLNHGVTSRFAGHGRSKA